MIVSPTNATEWQACASFLHEHAHIQPTLDARFLGWVSEGKLVIVVGLNAWLGDACQIHLAFSRNWHFAPRKMLHEVFNYSFNTAKRKILLGIVNSKNEKAMRMDLHLGFKELFRLPGLHDDGGDIVLLGMRREECRYLPKVETVEEAHA